MLENKAGELGEVAGKLAKAGINLHATYVKKTRFLIIGYSG